MLKTNLILKVTIVDSNEVNLISISVSNLVKLMNAIYRAKKLNFLIPNPRKTFI